MLSTRYAHEYVLNYFFRSDGVVEDPNGKHEYSPTVPVVQNHECFSILFTGLRK